MLKSIAEKQHYHAYIDGLRGIAILLVLMLHCFHALKLITDTPWEFPFLEGFVATGGLGVSLFFLVSAYTLFGSSKKRWGLEKHPTRNFYLRRAFRILPLWWLMVAIYGIEHDRSFSSLLPNFFMYFGFIRYQPGTEVMYVQWSLFVEEAFYLFLPLIFAFVRNGLHATYFFIGTFLVHYLWNQYAPTFGVPTQNNFIEMFPLTHWFCFGLGILMVFIHEDSQFKQRVLDSPRWGRLMGVGALIIALQTCRELFPYNVLSMIVIFFAAMHKDSWIGKLTRGKILRYFGVACYSMYLTHPLLISKLLPFAKYAIDNYGLGSLPFEILFFGWFVFVATINLALAAVIFQAIERPCVTFGKKFILAMESRRTLRAAHQNS